MKKEIRIALSKFDFLNDYDELEEKAEEAEFDASISLSVRHNVKDYEAVWVISGEEKNIASFIEKLDLNKYLKD